MADTGSAVQQRQAQDSRIAYVDRRKGRYMAQLLEDFEENVEPLLPAEVAKLFKVMVRRKLTAFSSDVIALLELGDMAKNQAAQELLDRFYPDGAPRRDTK